MEAVYYNRKGGMHYPLAFIAMLILLLLNASCSCGGAAVGILVKSNTTFGCNGRLEECLIMEDDLELEFLMNPYISRVLGSQSGGAGASTDRNKPYPCGKINDKPPQYAKCIPKTEKKVKHNCDSKRSTYDKGGCGKHAPTPITGL